MFSRSVAFSFSVGLAVLPYISATVYNVDVGKDGLTFTPGFVVSRAAGITFVNVDSIARPRTPFLVIKSSLLSIPRYDLPFRLDGANGEFQNHTVTQSSFAWVYIFGGVFPICSINFWQQSLWCFGWRFRQWLVRAVRSRNADVLLTILKHACRRGQSKQRDSSAHIHNTC